MRMWWNWEAMRAPPVADKASWARGCGRQDGSLLWQAKRLPGTTTRRRIGFRLTFRSLWIIEYADVVELVDSLDLGSNARACRFESCHPHQIKKEACASFFIWYGKELEQNKCNCPWTVVHTSSETDDYNRSSRQKEVNKRNTSRWDAAAAGQTDNTIYIVHQQSTPSDWCPCILQERNCIMNHPERNLRYNVKTKHRKNKGRNTPKKYRNTRIRNQIRKQASKMW